jgi:hypothetical protein
MPNYHELDTLVEAIMAGEGLRLLQRLSPQEKEVAWQILQQIKREGVSDWLNQLWELDYDIEPPTPQEFLESPEYFKHVGDVLYPKWKEELLVCLDPLHYKNEIIFRGCIGSGKSFVGGVIAGYELCLLLHLKSPQTFLKHAPTASIFLALISADLGQLEKNLWGYAVTAMKGSPFFKKHSSLKEEKEYKGLSIRFPKGIELMGGSLPAHVLGTNLYLAIMDEANYRRSSGAQEEAFAFYNKLRTRVDNRFIDKTGRGRVVLISSEGDEGSFLDTHCNNLVRGVKEGEEPDFHIIQHAEWEILGHTLEEKPTKWFRVDVGDNLRSPVILEEGEEPRQGARVIEVPDIGTYRKSATRDLIGFLKDRAGVVPGRANKYFYNVEAMVNAFQLPNMALCEVAELALDTQVEAYDYLDEARLLLKTLGVWKPRLHPEAARFMHIDLAKSQDLAGVAMCHVGDYAEGGSPIIFEDFCLGFSASKHKPIDFDKIIGLILWLRERGFHIPLVTYDSYQSVHSLNILEKRGFSVKMRSMDIVKNTPQGRLQLEYYEFRSMIAVERIKLVNCARLRREAVELLNLGDKPEHPENGSKDLIDATVGAVANAVESVKDREGFGDRFNLGAARTTGLRNPRELITQDQLTGDIDRSGDDVFIDP